MHCVGKRQKEVLKALVKLEKKGVLRSEVCIVDGNPIKVWKHAELEDEPEELADLIAS